MQERIEFLSSELVIRGTLVVPKELETPASAVIFFHGMTSSEDGYIPPALRLAGKRIIALPLSMSGHGRSDGDFETVTVTQLIEDGLAAYDYLTSLDIVDPKRIGLSGTSVGAVVACLTAAERDVQAMVLRVPAVYTEDMEKMTLAQTMKNEAGMFGAIANPEATPAVEAIAGFAGKLLVILSENDQILPPALTESYFKAAHLSSTRQITVISEATHNLSKQEWKAEYWNLLVNWFKETL